MPETELAAMYRRVKRPVEEGTAADAIKMHSQACGLVAYVFNVHPDVVAREVAEEARARSGAHRG